MIKACRKGSRVVVSLLCVLAASSVAWAEPTEEEKRAAMLKMLDQLDQLDAMDLSDALYEAQKLVYERRFDEVERRLIEAERFVGTDADQGRINDVRTSMAQEKARVRAEEEERRRLEEEERRMREELERERRRMEREIEEEREAAERRRRKAEKAKHHQDMMNLVNYAAHAYAEVQQQQVDFERELSRNVAAAEAAHARRQQEELERYNQKKRAYELQQAERNEQALRDKERRLAELERQRQAKYEADLARQRKHNADALKQWNSQPGITRSANTSVEPSPSAARGSSSAARPEPRELSGSYRWAGANTGEAEKIQGTLTRRGFTVAGVRVDSFDVKYSVSSFMQEPVVGGSFKWTSSDPDATLPASLVVWLKIQNGRSHGYIRLSPAMPKANGGYGYNVSGSPDWDELVCSYRGGSRTDSMTEEQANDMYRGGRIVGFELSHE